MTNPASPNNSAFSGSALIFALMDHNAIHSTNFKKVLSLRDFSFVVAKSAIKKIRI